MVSFRIGSQYGSPPKVAWLNVGNAGTSVILNLLRESRDEIVRFVAAPEEALLIVRLVQPDGDADQAPDFR